MSSTIQNNTSFIFPQTNSASVPDPSKFFSPNLLSTPLPTNSFFQNFSLREGETPEYIHPYLIGTRKSSLSFSYPSRYSNSSFLYQEVKDDDIGLTVSTIQKNFSPIYDGRHVITSYSDLGVTLDYPATNLSFFLVRGSPYLTFSVKKPSHLLISTSYDIRSVTSNWSRTKFTIQHSNNQTWVLYASSPIKLSHETFKITSKAFSGIIRIALLPDSDPKYKAILDRFSSCYPLSGDAKLSETFCLEYKFEKKGSGDLLLLAHPLHIQLLSKSKSDVSVLDDFKYQSIDGDLVGVVGDSWLLKTDPISVTWHSSKGIKEESYDEIVSSLLKDVEGLNSSAIKSTSSYFYGQLIARAARLALIAEEVFFFDAIQKVRSFLKETIEPWLDGTFNGNGFLYDKKWGGIITQEEGAFVFSSDLGDGAYNDHHYQLGYFLYGIAVLVKIDPAWGSKYKTQSYSLLEDFMNLSIKSNSNYTRLRFFDLYKLHSWTVGLTNSEHGRYQESTSEAVNAYYAAALMGMAYGDPQLVSIASTLTSLEILGTKMWWHVKKNGKLYEEEFTKENRIIGILRSNKRESNVWVAPCSFCECEGMLGVHVLPLCPISEVLFSDVDYVKELVEWALPPFKTLGAENRWKGFVYALEGIYDNESALKKIRSMNRFEVGNSLTNLLWWIHSRGEGSDDE